jgi:hypothetical protein
MFIDRTLERRPPDLGGSVPHELRPYVCNPNGDVEGVPEVIDLTLEPTVAVDVESLPEPPLQMAPIKSDPEDNEAHSKGTIRGMLSMVAEYIDSSLSLQEFEADWAELPEITLTAAGPPREGEEKELLLPGRQGPYGDAALGGLYLSRMTGLETLIIAEPDGMMALMVAIAEHGWGGRLKRLILDFDRYDFFDPTEAAGRALCRARDLVPHVIKLSNLEAVRIQASVLRVIDDSGVREEWWPHEALFGEATKAMRALCDVFDKREAFPKMKNSRSDYAWTKGYHDEEAYLLLVGEEADDDVVGLADRDHANELRDVLQPGLTKLTLQCEAWVGQLAAALKWWQAGVLSDLRVLRIYHSTKEVKDILSILDSLGNGACPALRELALIDPYYPTSRFGNWHLIGEKLESMGKRLKVEVLNLGVMDDEALASAIRKGAVPHLKTLVITPTPRAWTTARATWRALRERMGRVPGIRILLGPTLLRNECPFTPLPEDIEDDMEEDDDDDEDGEKGEDMEDGEEEA